MRYTHDYIDYIRYYTSDIMTKSHIHKKYKKISLLCFDYLMEIINLSENYTYDNIWLCDKISASNKPFTSFIEKNQNQFANELEQTVISFILQNQYDDYTNII
jgi:hypothetical protein